MNQTALRPILTSILLLATASNTQAAIQTINFDTDAMGNPITAPSLFSAATPLTNLYADYGVNFTALARTPQTAQVPRDGIEVTQTVNVMQTSTTGMGSILNEASNFGNNAKSGDNFLAFNNQSAASSNFWRVSFDNPIGYFGISFSNGSSSTYQYLDFDAYDVNGKLIGSSYNPYLGEYSYYINNYVSESFKSDIGIAYIDIAQGMNCCGTSLTNSLRSGTWSLNFDDLFFGDASDASAYTYNISNANAYVPIPGAIWMMLSGLLGVVSLSRSRLDNLAVNKCNEAMRG